eukprot:15475950-Alexandrium_andersonii.AAC.1
MGKRTTAPWAEGSAEPIRSGERPCGRLNSSTTRRRTLSLPKDCTASAACPHATTPSRLPRSRPPSLSGERPPL